MGKYDFRNEIPLAFYVDISPHNYVSFGPYLGVLMAEYLYFDVGMRGNFHWWQLLDDKLENRNLRASVLDFYASAYLGPQIGTGGYKGERVSFKAGGMAGFRYYFVRTMGLMTEIGWPPEEFVTVGFSFRINPF